MYLLREEVASAPQKTPDHAREPDQRQHPAKRRPDEEKIDSDCGHQQTYGKQAVGLRFVSLEVCFDGS